MLLIPAPKQGLDPTATISLGSAYDEFKQRGLITHVVDDPKATLKADTESGTRTLLQVFASAADSELQENMSWSVEATVRYLAASASASFSSSQYFHGGGNTQITKLRFIRQYAPVKYQANPGIGSGLLPVLPGVQTGGVYGTGVIVGYVPCRFVDLDISTNYDYSQRSSELNAGLRGAVSGIGYGVDINAGYQSAISSINKDKIVNVTISYSGDTSPVIISLNTSDDPVKWLNQVQTELDRQDTTVTNAVATLTERLSSMVLAAATTPSSPAPLIPQTLRTNSGTRVALAYLYAPYTEILAGPGGVEVDEGELSAISLQLLQLGRYLYVIQSILADPNRQYGWIMSEVQMQLEELYEKLLDRRDLVISSLKALIRGQQLSVLPRFSTNQIVLPEPYLQAVEVTNDPRAEKGWQFKVIVDGGNFTHLLFSSQYYIEGELSSPIHYDVARLIDLTDGTANSQRVVPSFDCDLTSGKITLQVIVVPYKVVPQFYPDDPNSRSRAKFSLYGPGPEVVKTIEIAAVR